MKSGRAWNPYANVGLRFDGWLLLAIVGLLMLGYVMMSSASIYLGAIKNDNALYFPVRQFAHIVLGIVAAGAVLAIKMEFWEKSGQWLFLAGLALLVVVLIPGVGVKVNGSVRWLQFAGVRIQVSEAVKLISVIYMAGYVTRNSEIVRVSSYGLLKPLILFSFACLLLLLEPDFGSAVVILTIALGIMYLGGARLWQFGALLAISVLLGWALVYTSEYRMARVTSFLNPWADPQDKGFQLVQALIAFGRGEWMGVGLGGSIQKLLYLPEAHTDFLFSVIAEELGLLGVITVIALFSILIWRAFSIGRNAERAGLIFSSHVAYGLAIWVGFQAFVNMGVNMGMLPTKGLTLPLMSYGGGSMIVMCCALALLFRIHAETEAIVSNIPRGKPEWIGAS
ncbi:MAG: putative lipid II flippase FtsW [Gammaproteobacteria bacterium]